MQPCFVNKTDGKTTCLGTGVGTPNYLELLL
jgi:hypothetical protein